MSQDPKESPSLTPTSSPSIEPAQERSDFSVLISRSQPNVVEKSNAALEAALQKESDERRTERFVWIFVLTIIASVLMFKTVESAAACASIFALILIFLIFTAKWLGVEQVVVPLERLFERILNCLPGDKK